MTGSMRNRLNQWMLAALLVISQSVLLVHQADIDHHVEADDDCLVCLVAAGHDDSLNADIASIGFHMGSGHVPVPPGTCAVSLHTFSQRARAPPVDTLHV